jgi:hypothetical protein
VFSSGISHFNRELHQIHPTLIAAFRLNGSMIATFPVFRLSRFPPVAVKMKQQDSQSSECDVFHSTH